MKRHKDKDARPYVAWSIMADMLRSFDDEQLQTLDGLVAREVHRRRREDPRQRHLWGAQAVELTTGTVTP